jgi:hypothetical protein
MTKRLIDVDDDLVKDVQAYLGTKTLKATINAALREIKRRQSVEAELAWWSTDPLPEARDPEFKRKTWDLPPSS